MSHNHKTYNYCNICGHSPKQGEPMNTTMKYWDPDDGWVIAALCPGCKEDYGNVKPQPDDYAYSRTNQVCDIENTDEDIIDLF